MSANRRILGSLITLLLLVLGGVTAQSASAVTSIGGPPSSSARAVPAFIGHPHVYRFTTLPDGRLHINVGPNLPGTGRWRYQLHRQDGDDWVRVYAQSYKGRGYFYTQGTAEVFTHTVPRGVYRVWFYPGQHGFDSDYTSDPYNHTRYTPSVRMKSDQYGRLMVQIGYGSGRGWRYQLHRKVDDRWVRVYRESYRNRGYFYTQGSQDKFRHSVRPGVYRVYVYPDQFGNERTTTAPFTHTWSPPDMTMRTTYSGKLIVNIDPNLPGTGRWRYQLHRKVGDDWVQVSTDSYKDRGYFYTQGTAERFIHTVPDGTYRVRVAPDQHGSIAGNSEPWIHLTPELASIDAGGGTVCALDQAKRAWCWGSNSTGQLGIGSGRQWDEPVMVHGGHSFSTIDVGPSHACAIDTDGSAWCWGKNVNGQLGDGTTKAKYTPTQVTGGHVFTSINAGHDHTCALDTDGDAWCWGYNLYGQVGDDSTTDRRAPSAVAGGHTFTSVSAGHDHSCALDASGQAWCWGYGRKGQIGDGTVNIRHVPTAVAGGHTFTFVEAGGLTTVALDTDGRAWWWGPYYFDDYMSHNSRPDPFGRPWGGAVDSWTTISSDEGNRVAINIDGSTWYWGFSWAWDEYTGYGSADYAPDPLPGGHEFTTVTAGSAVSCGIDTASVVWCWWTRDEGPRPTVKRVTD